MKPMNPWYKEYFVYDATKALTAGSGTVFEAINIKMDPDANFEIYRMSYIATDNRIKLKMSNIERNLFKNPVDIKTIAGSNNALTSGYSVMFMPFTWPRPFLIPAGSTLTIEAADFSGSANTMRLALHGAKIRSGYAPWEKQFRGYIPVAYGFDAGAQTVSASSTAVGRIEIEIDAHFVVEKITGIRTGAATIQITEGERQRDWSNTAIHIDNLIGNGSFPNILPAKRFIRKSSVIIVNMTDLSAASNSIEVNLIGQKLYE